MIGWRDVYKVVAAMVPLYAPLTLGYGSVKWWNMFKAEQCDTINRLSFYFILPFFTFEFVARVNPYQMNGRFVAADVISKLIIGAVLVLWANLTAKGSFSWSITIFSLSTLNNTLVIGVPLLQAMYDRVGADLAIQSFVMQSILWFPALLFLLEFWYRRTKMASVETTAPTDLEESNNNSSSAVAVSQTNMSFWSLMKIVPVKVVKNPNCFACIIAIIWALVSNKWHLQMPSIAEGSILIMSKAGGGIAMFSIGLFIALQEKVIACGAALTLFGMVLRFILGPATLAIGSLIVGLRGDVFNITIILAALPQAITSFIFAKEYGLHANVASTAVIFGTIASLPVLIAYYAVFESLH